MDPFQAKRHRKWKCRTNNRNPCFLTSYYVSVQDNIFMRKEEPPNDQSMRVCSADIRLLSLLQRLKKRSNESKNIGILSRGLQEKNPALLHCIKRLAYNQKIPPITRLIRLFPLLNWVGIFGSNLLSQNYLLPKTIFFHFFLLVSLYTCNFSLSPSFVQLTDSSQWC